MHEDNTYIILFEEDIAFLASGKDPCDAIKEHYDTMDLYCSTETDNATSEIYATVLGLPSSFESETLGKLHDMDSEELAAELPKLLSRYEDITTTVINVAYGPDGVSASEVKTPSN
jgi:hypothetical protein